MNMKRIALILTTLLLLVTPAAAAEEGTTFDQIMVHYEAIRGALLHDTTVGVAEHAGEIETLARSARSSFEPTKVGVAPRSSNECLALLEDVEKTATALEKAGALSDARARFAELSRPLVRMREMSTGKKPLVVYCSMAKKSWLQPDGEIGNPYFGQKMARCGEVVSE